MKYRIREGLVRETVCGRELLIATLQAREHCPYLTELNSASAFLWDILEKEPDIDTEKIVGNVMAEYELSYEEALSAVDAFLTELEKKAYIIRN